MSGEKKSFWDVRSPALRPLWLRVVLVAVCGVWTVVEAVSGSPFWMIIFGAATVHLFWQLIVTYDRGSEG
jgi:hypothetical protein